MKLNLMQIIAESFMFCVFILCFFLIIYFPKEAPEGFESIRILYYGLIIIDTLILGYLIIELFTGSLYYEYVYYTLDDFEIKEYENKVIIIYNNYAYSFINKKDEIARLKQIKIKKFYNIKRKYIDWEFAIYEQL